MMSTIGHFFDKLFAKLPLNGWKSILAYVGLQLPWVSEHPMLIDAVNDFLLAPQDPKRIFDLGLQILLAAGLLHKGAKNINS